MQSQVRNNRVPEKVPEKVPGSLGANPSQVQRVPEILEKVPEKVGEALVQSEKVWEALEQAEVFPALGFAARFRNICKNKTLRLLGIPLKLIFNAMCSWDGDYSDLKVASIWHSWTKQHRKKGTRLTTASIKA